MPEDQHLELCLEVAELRARAVSYREIAKRQQTSISTAHRRFEKWQEWTVKLQRLEVVRGAMGQRADWIYAQHVAHYSQILRAPVKGMPLREGQDPEIPVMTLGYKTRLLLHILEQMRRDVELHAKVMGAFTEIEVNLGPQAGATILHQEVSVPHEPDNRRELGDLLRRADRLVQEGNGVSTPCLPGGVHPESGASEVP